MNFPRVLLYTAGKLTKQGGGGKLKNAIQDLKARRSTRVDKDGRCAAEPDGLVTFPQNLGGLHRVAGKIKK